MDQFIGCDSCSAGWICFVMDSDKNWRLELFRSIQELWSSFSHPKLVLIDIPIGLRDESGKPRLCDREARKYLTRKRSSSIFPTPCREILKIKNYQKANKTSKERCGKGISKQTWNIIPEIIEVDEFLRKNEKMQKCFIECHPEVCFTALNKDTPLDYYKKTEKGIKHRFDLLTSYLNYEKNPLERGLKKYKRKDVALDDILDAWVLGLSASLGRKNLSFLPEDYEYDSKNLPMRIAKPQFFES
jgi:predicted RNase H-like nuclease